MAEGILWTILRGRILWVNTCASHNSVLNVLKTLDFCLTLDRILYEYTFTVCAGSDSEQLRRSTYDAVNSIQLERH